MLRMAQLKLKGLISAPYNQSSLTPIRRALPLLLFSPKTHISSPFRPLSTVTAAGRRGYQRVAKFQQRGITPEKKDTAAKKMSSPAEKISADTTEGEPKGFNMKRAQGLDKAGPKELKLKTRQINPVNTTCYVQILGTGMDTHDTSPSVLLFFDQQRFIFNAGEGLQRFCTEHKIKLSRIDHIFLTRVGSETAGGLPGLLLTMAGIGDDGMTVNIWGPSDLRYLIDAMRLFIPNAAVVHTHSFGPGYSKEKLIVQNSNESLLTNPITLVKDDIVKISAILLLPNATERREDIDVSMLNAKNAEESLNAVHKRPRLGSESSSEIRELASGFWATYKPGDIAVVYMCELPDIKGKFDPSKAAALGLKPGPKYRELQLGNSVMSDRMELTVHPSDVMGPSSPGPIVLLVDCPTVSHLPCLLSAPAFHGFFAGAENDLESHHKSVSCIIHLSPAAVTICPEYKQWMSKFVGAQHIMAGHEVKNTEFPILKSSARLSSRLNFLCPQLFPVPGFQSLCRADTSEAASIQPRQVESLMSEGSIPAENLLKFCLRPYARLGMDRSSIPSLPAASDIIDELLSEIPEIEGASKVIAQLWNPVLIKENKNTELTDVQGTASNILEEPWLHDERCKSNSGVEGTSNEDSLKETQLIAPIEVEECNCSDEIPECLDGVTREEMEIVFLGTGSSQPSKYRNVSAIYINLFSQGGILLDCGEGTLGQLKRRFGVRGADDVIKGLKCIWISHIHADHHTGLARILSLREQLLKNESHESLLVIGPRQLKKFLDAYSRIEDLSMQFLDCRQTVEASINAYEELNRSGDKEDGVENNNKDGSNHSGQAFKKDNLVVGNNVQFKSESRPDMSSFTKNQMKSYWQRPGFFEESTLDITGLNNLKKVISEAGLEMLISVPVVHCPQAFGVVLQAACRNINGNKTVPGWKLVYSGDTRPCKNLMDAARGATVLIHEATFDDSMPEEAISRNHSLTKEAIEVGASAGAYRIILTHFSQRYPKIPVFDESYTDRTCIAFDMMSVNLADLPLVPKINPYLKLLFKNEMLVDDAVENENVIQDATVE